MGKLRTVLFGILLLFSGEAFCTDPPSPTMMSSTSTPPPPPGLPLPIDDYLPLLLIAGIFLGMFYLQKSRKLN